MGDILKLNVSASLSSGISLTGALDDAAASLIGGLVVTNNIGKRILLHKDIGEYNVLIAYPERRIATSSFRDTDFSPIKGLMHGITNLLLKGDWRAAMTLNGFVYTVFLGYDTEPIHLALRSGVEAVSLSGKGPAFAAVTKEIGVLKRKWRELGWKLLLSKTR
jgi:shikimate kinase